MGHSDRISCVLGLLVLAVVVACKGSSSSEAAPGASGATTLAAAQSGEKLIKCGDFFSRADVAALGFDASRYDEGATQQSEGLNVLCHIGQVLAAISGGRAYDMTRDGAEDAIKKGIIKKGEGPAIGSASHWTVMGPMSTVAFRSTSKKYAATISGRDQTSVEKVARALDAKMN